MKPLPASIEAEIAANTNAKVYQRGVDYYADGLVLSVTRRGGLIQAEVQGSEDEPYLVSVTVGAKGVKDAECTCPYGEEWDGWCKHVIAVLLFCRDSPGEVEERPALETLLGGLDEKQLRALVVTLAADNPRLVEEIAGFIGRAERTD